MTVDLTIWDKETGIITGNQRDRKQKAPIPV